MMRKIAAMETAASNASDSSVRRPYSTAAAGFLLNGTTLEWFRLCPWFEWIG